MNRKPMYKAIVAIVVALAFVMPVAAFANVGTIGVTSDNENTSEIENIVETSTNSDISYTIETTSDYEPIEDPFIDTEELSIVIDDSSAVLGTRNTIYVDDDADPSWYDATHVKTINEGITNATAGDMVYVYNGAYREHVTVNKQLDLVGESRENVIVDGSGSGEVVKVTANGVSIDTFTIMNGSFGLRLHQVSNSNIMNCNICGNSGGIIYAFRLDSSPSTITNCDVYGNSGSIVYGLYLSSSPSIITNCNVYNNSGSIVYGLYLSSSPSSIINCDVYNNNNYGIYLSSSSNSKITNCDVRSHTYGIYLSGSSNSDIINCDVRYNMYGIYLSGSSDNQIHHNNFVSNTYNAHDACSNIWDDGSEGNYWSDYTGVDEDGDGIGDTPYNIPGGSNQDRYPLMAPLDNTLPEITDVEATPPSQVPGGYVNITATVTDNVAVDTVTVNITCPCSTFIVEVMTNIPGTHTYYYNATYIEIGMYDYFIWVNDTSGNDVTSGTYQFEITEIDAPRQR